MTINSILLHAAAENCEPHRGPANYAVQLARAFDAHLTALIFELDVALPRGAYGKRFVAEARTTVTHRNEEAIKRARELHDAAQQAGVRAAMITDRSYAYTVPEVVVEHARLRDLAVAGVDEFGLLNEHVITEDILFQSGRPVIVVPKEQATPFSCNRVVVAWDFGRTAARALGDAMPLLRKAGDVTLVTFGDDKQIDAGLSRDEVVTALGHRGVTSRFDKAERGSRTIGEAINNYAREHAANLLVMGGYGHSRFREFVLGGATREILKNPTVPTLLSH